VNLEGISCLCLTYGRPSLLEESIECFKRQTWTGRKELLIINDLPDQKLLFDDDEVVIVNLNRRVRTLGEKRNLSAALARYDYLFIWDDDDIYLPWRLDETMKYLPERRFFKSAAAWVINRGVLKTEPAVENIEPIPNMNFAGGPRFYVTTPIDRQDEPCVYLFHGGAAYTRTLFEEIRGYSCVNSGEDLDFENRLKQHPKLAACFNSTVLPRERIYYIYRSHHGHYNASGGVKYDEIRPQTRRGSYRLQPHWKTDYCAEVASRF
jgi:glycosyltransferase involved in cell wall biosynthesis